MCTLCSKNHPTILLSISLPNVKGFSNFFHWCILWTIGNKVIIEYPIALLLCCYTTLWNINVRKTNNVIASKRFGKWKTRQTKMRWMTCTTLHWVWSIFFVERCVCLYWPSCLSEPTSSFTALVMFSLVLACITLPVSCLWLCFLFLKSLLLTCPFCPVFPFCSLS